MSVKIKTPFDPTRAHGIHRVTEVDHNAFGDVVVRQWTEYEHLRDNNTAHHIQILTFNDPEVVEIVRKADALALRNTDPDTLAEECPRHEGTWKQCDAPRWSPIHAFCIRLRKGGPILFFDRGWVFTFEVNPHPLQDIVPALDFPDGKYPMVVQWFKMKLYGTVVSPNIKQEFSRDTIITDMAKLIDRISNELDAKEAVPEDIVVEADRIMSIINEVLGSK